MRKKIKPMKSFLKENPKCMAKDCKNQAEGPGLLALCRYHRDLLAGKKTQNEIPEPLN